MVDRRDSFDKAAKAAAADGSASERELAGALADQFQRDPAHFNPERLTLLGRSELMHLLVLVRGEAHSSGEVDEPDPQCDSNRRAADWAGLRCPETSSWLGNVGMGVAFGCSVLLTFLIVSLLLA